MGYPQTNGEAKVMNRMILQGHRTRLDEAKSRWVEERPRVLWAYHTTSRALTNEIPFNLVFGTETVILMEIDLPTLWMERFDKLDNLTCMLLNLDLPNKIRDKALLMAAYQQQAAWYYNSRVKFRSFLSGDLILCRSKVS